MLYWLIVHLKSEPLFNYIKHKISIKTRKKMIFADIVLTVLKQRHEFFCISFLVFLSIFFNPYKVTCAVSL